MEGRHPGLAKPIQKARQGLILMSLLMTFLGFPMICVTTLPCQRPHRQALQGWGGSRQKWERTFWSGLEVGLRVRCLRLGETRDQGTSF